MKPLVVDGLLSSQCDLALICQDPQKPTDALLINTWCGITLYYRERQDPQMFPGQGASPRTDPRVLPAPAQSCG